MSKKTDHWMPIYIGDYLADTGHLSTTQHGAYLLLMMHYWRKGGLPDDDKQLSAIAKLPLRIWLDMKETVQAFFHDGWRHKRIDAELSKRDRISKERADAGSKGGKSKANATVLLEQNGSMVQSPKQEGSEAIASGAEAPPDPSEPERQLFRRGKEILGPSSGGQIAKLLKAAGGNVALARSKIELAATKENPAQFIAKVITTARDGLPAKPLTQHQRERETTRDILNELDQFISGDSSQADLGLLRHDTGSGPEGIHGGIRGDIIHLPASRTR